MAVLSDCVAYGVAAECVWSGGTLGDVVEDCF